MQRTLIFLFIILLLLTSCSTKDNGVRVELNQGDESPSKEAGIEKDISKQEDENKGIIKRQLKVADPVSEILDKLDIYPVLPEIDFLKKDSGKTTIWDIVNYRVLGFLLKRDENSNLYLSRAYDEYEETADVINITEYLNGQDINISKIRLAVLNISYDGNWLIFSIDDDNTKAFFISRWDFKKHLYTRTLSEEIFKNYDINNAAVIPNPDCLEDENSFLDIYTYTKNKINYLLVWNPDINRIIEYRLPEEIKEIEKLYTYYNSSYYYNDLNLFEGKKDKIYIQALTISNDYTVSYEIDLTTHSIKRYNTVKNLKDTLDIEWTFKGDVENLTVVDRVDDISLIYGHDGQFSGYHDDEYLYAVDMKTGKKLWSVYSGYMGPEYSVSSDKKYILVSIPLYNKIQYMDIYSGEIIWEKDTNNLDYIDDGIMLGKEEFIIFKHKKDIIEEDVLKLTAYNQKTSSLLWEKELKGSSLLFKKHNAPYVITKGDNGITAYDSKTGEESWKINTPTSIVSGPYTGQMHDWSAIIGNPIYWNNINKNEKGWFAFEDGFRLIDFKTGRVLEHIESNTETLVLLDEEYKILRRINETSCGEKYGYYHFRPGKTEFGIYSDLKKKMLWKKDEVLLCATRQKDRLYYVTDSKIKCVEITTGKALWENRFPSNFDQLFSIQPLVIKDELFIVYRNIIYSFNIENGELLYQAGDYFTQYSTIWSSTDDYHLTMHRDGDYLFIGKRSGMLDLIKID